MLQYPLELNTGLTDSVSFRPEEYRSNAAARRDGAAASPPSPTGMSGVTLYMPNSTPLISNLNSWENVDFVGPLGAAKRDLAVSTTKALMDAGTGQQSTYADDLKRQVQGLAANGGAGASAAGKQALLQAGASQFGLSPTTLLALSKGQIYNPNVELIYQGPKMRSFVFDFMFIAKSSEENTRVNDIIRMFKKSSAPAENGGMFEVPYVFSINYMTGGRPNPNMNKFKKSALISLSVQANPTSDMHVAHAGGAPIATMLQMTFQEVDLVLRSDHGSSGQGF